MLGELLIPAGFLLAIDQASKKLTFERLGRAKRSRSDVGRRPRLRPLLNRTIALGLVCDRRALVILWGFAALGTIVLTFHAPAFQTSAARVGFGAALGGAASNLFDWLRRGAVMDFIDLRIWPVFNIADAAIVLGVVVALCSAGWSAMR
jgi:signal peptidase II